MSWNKVKAELIGMASVFDVQINEAGVEWFVSSVSDMDSQLVIQALRKYGQNAKGHKLPTPAEIRAIINPELDMGNEAKEAAARIVQAIGKFGYPSPDEARAFIGELGWRVVVRLGGWGHLCEKLGSEMNESTFYAQARDLAKSTIERGSIGLDQTAPQLALHQKEVLQKLLE